jgi:hypothetical protein
VSGAITGLFLLPRGGRLYVLESLTTEAREYQGHAQAKWLRQRQNQPVKDVVENGSHGV